MRARRGQVVEIGTLAEFDRRTSVGVSSMTGWQLLSVDLSQRSSILRRCAVAGALFLGCRFAPGDEQSIRSRGAIVFPEVPGSPVDTYRSLLYAPRDLYDSADYQHSFDARAYGWTRAHQSRESALATTLHDLAIDEALADWTIGRELVGVMGGHAAVRGEAGYLQAAQLGRLLTRGGATVVTGGGPGAMEAANLGAWMARRSAAELTRAVDDLSLIPSFTPDVGGWARVAFEVLDEFPDGEESLGIPTWHYGHEPPNPFATAIAKYFKNSTREAILLQICNRGIVFLPGAAGTVQEVFQDACENYYADESSVAKMVLVGVQHWTRTLPVWPLLANLAKGRPMEQQIHLVDTLDEAAALVCPI
ncbi:LOG family protein [Nocardioides sp. Bht2]|uniref:LOG family protein n=1 Tax=Nocardioides sp. Bht2 TaxID=3392297 RepID=UPI0039B6D262